MLPLPGAWTPHLAPSLVAGTLSCAGQEAAHAQEHGRSSPCPVRPPLLTLSAEAQGPLAQDTGDFKPRLFSTLPRPAVGCCLLLMLLESQRSSVGVEEKRSANVQALSEAHKDNVCRTSL